MTPADRLDAMLRTELHQADVLPVSDRYDAVLARSAQRTRRRRASLLAGAVAVVATVGGAGLLVEQRPEQAPVVVDPAQRLEGSWSRTVDGQRWTITFGSAAALGISAPADAPEGADGASYAVTASILRIDAFANGPCTELLPGSYRWTLRTSTVLRLQASDETCDTRRHVFDGAWTASP
jgi:hypothetical protein